MYKEPYDPDPSICDGCKGCITLCRYEPFPEEYDYLKLINVMAENINSLEAEIVRTRQILAGYLPMHLMTFCHNGTDPLDNDNKTRLMLRLRDGTDETSYYHLMKK